MLLLHHQIHSVAPPLRLPDEERPGGKDRRRNRQDHENDAPVVRTATGKSHHATCQERTDHLTHRPPQRLAGVGFSAQGAFEGAYYLRAPGADDPRAAWILEGVAGEIIGNFGFSGGGAAGFELDRMDHRLGSPENAIIIASSTAHQESHIVVPEEVLTHRYTWSMETHQELVRSDMTYFETPAGGAVFSVGSITFCGSLAHAGYDNEISTIINNVLTRFSAEA